MSDYSLQVTWSTKDALATGSQLKAVSATELGNEFSAIATAVATKYDSDDLASTAEAEGLSLTGKLLSPGTLNDVLVDNAGILKDLQQLTVAGFGGADALLAWDTGTSAAKGFTLGTGLAFSGDTVALSSTLQALHGLAVTDGNVIVGNGSTWVAESGATARTSLGLAVGTDVQAWDANLDQIAALAVTNGNFIVGNGSAWVAESGATARTSLGLGTSDTPQFNGVHIGSTSTTVSEEAAGHIAVEGQTVAQHGTGQTNANYSSADIFMSTSAATGGASGDIWFQYTA